MLLLGRIVAALVSGALLAQAYSLHPCWPLAWIAPIPVLIAAMGASRREAFAFGAIAGAVSMALTIGYFLELSGPAPTAVIALLKALMWGGAVLAARTGARDWPAWAAVFVFPALMAGLETLIAAVSPHGSAGALAYSQMDFLPAIQVLASLGGAPAITFVVTLFASAFVFLTSRRWVGAIAPSAIVAAALLFGLMPRGPSSPDGAALELGTTRFALLAGDQFEGVPGDWRTVWAAYAPQIERAADEDYRIVVMPEKLAELSADERELAVEYLAEIARRREVLLVFGVDAVTEEGRFNRAYAAGPEGAPQSYDKRHMIPGYESHFDVGAGNLIVADQTGARFGVAICKDMDFPALARGYAGVQAVLVPAWDFGTDAWLHSRMAVLRGVENGFWVVRSARNGALTVSDWRGRVVAEGASGPQTAIHVEAMAWAPGPTLYARIGDVFGWACLAVAALLLGWAARRGAG